MGQLKPIPHIHDDLLELYALGRVESEELFTKLESHIRLCPTCTARVDALASEASLLKDALERLQPLFSHASNDGQISAYVRPSVSGVYIARLIGPVLDCGARCSSAEEARQWCTNSFRDMFPEHECGPECRPGLSFNG